MSTFTFAGNKMSLGMKWFLMLVFAGISLAGGALFSLILTAFTWETCVEGHLFYCTDDTGIGIGMWTPMSEHRQGGDYLMGSWTWDGLESLRLVCVVAFFVIWIAGSAGSFFMLLKLGKKLLRRPVTV